MPLLNTPPDLAKCWTVLQASLWFPDLSPKAFEGLFHALDEDTAADTTLYELWSRLDFCAQVELAEAMEKFDQECLSDEDSEPPALPPA